MSEDRATVIHNVAGVRAAPESGAEQISQAILGDTVEILERSAGFARQRGHDDYEGWILESHLQSSAPGDSRAPESSDGYPVELHVWSAFAEIASEGGEPITRLVFGTQLHGSETIVSNGDPISVLLPNGIKGIVEARALKPADDPPIPLSQLETVARRFLGTPYLWGGTTPFGFDCSGLVQRIFTAAGVILPRDAHLQAQSPLGRMLPEGAPLHPADLVFFSGTAARPSHEISHVGMMLDEHRMIHAYGKGGVSIHHLDDPEIAERYKGRGAWRLRESEPSDHWV